MTMPVGPGGSVRAYVAVAAPVAGNILVLAVPALVGVTYLWDVEITGYIDGTPSATDEDNVRFNGTDTLTYPVEASVFEGAWSFPAIPAITGSGAPHFTLAAILAATAGSVYHFRMTATPVTVTNI